MYYKYKVKKKNYRFLKLILLFSVIFTSIYFAYEYRQYLTFWKYSHNKIVEKIENSSKIKDNVEKQHSLQKLSKVFDVYKSENPLKPESYFLSGKVHYKLGLSYLPGSFSEMLINDKIHNINESAKKEFLQAIKEINKGKALLDDNSIEDKYSIILAVSSYYYSFYSEKDLYKIIKKCTVSKQIKNVEHIRFLSIMNILNKDIDPALDYLKNRGNIEDTIQGKLFLATAEKMSKRYTDAIINYKNVLSKVSDENVLKLIHINLGKIYYNQSLYKESLDQFSYALKIDERDNLMKIWIGRNYSAMGEKDKAKAIWSEVLASDRANIEVKKLLQIM